MPRTLVVEEGKPSEVTRIVREVLLQRGARLDEQTHARTVFEGLASPGGFARGGYVGVYQPVGEKGVEVLLEAYAIGPRRAFWAAVGLALVAALGMVAVSPPSVAWFLAGIVLWVLFGLAALGYYLTFRGTRALEDDLAADLAPRLEGAGKVLDEDRLLERGIRERLEGELKERELAQRPPPEPRPRPARRAEAPSGPGKPGLFGRGRKA